jgi:sporulation protein YlmC with PRC-barrel domain
MAQFVKCVAESFALSDAFRDRSGSKWADRHCAVLSVVVRLVATPYDVFFSSHFIGQTLVASELGECNGVFPNTFFQLRRRFQCSNPRSPSRYWPAFAANDYPSARMQTALPSEAMTVTDWYKQNVYDPNENKIGDIKDVLVDKSGKVVALIVGVGGFLGAGEKDVAVPFEAVHPTMKEKNWWLVINTTKDSLRSAPGFKYDSNTTTWVPDRP